MNTDQGAVSTGLTISLISLPKTSDEITNNLNASFQMRVAQAVIDKILLSYLIKEYNINNNSAVSNTVSTTVVPTDKMTELTQDVQTIMNQLVSWGYIQRDNTDYIVSFIRKGLDSTLNGKPISDADLAMIGPNVNQLLSKSTAVAPATTSQVTPSTSIQSGYGCYWMDNTSGKNQWVLMPNLLKADCFSLDSCNGGLNRSNGGCYKWATAPDAQAEPWQ
jgi:hypothetical protein